MSACGTATAWRRGCRCRRCRRALRTAAKVWGATAQLRRGRDPATRVSPKQMLRHIDELVASGMTVRQIALAARVAPSTLGRARHQKVTVSRIVEAAVLAVES